MEEMNLYVAARPYETKTPLTSAASSPLADSAAAPPPSAGILSATAATRVPTWPFTSYFSSFFPRETMPDSFQISDKRFEKLGGGDSRLFILIRASLTGVPQASSREAYLETLRSTFRSHTKCIGDQIYVQPASLGKMVSPKFWEDFFHEKADAVFGKQPTRFEREKQEAETREFTQAMFGVDLRTHTPRKGQINADTLRTVGRKS